MGANEHSPANPTWLGGKIWAVNKTDGTLLWKIDSIQDETQPIAAYGNQIVYLNFYDGKLYDIGKGPSQITVTAPQVQVTSGETVTITGSVLDKAPGATQTEQAARFPNGLPCISDASMDDWMNYVYMQKPAPTDATGVEVTISAIDPNHNYITLGTTVSDSNGNYGFTWKTPRRPRSLPDHRNLQRNQLVLGLIRHNLHEHRFGRHSCTSRNYQQNQHQSLTNTSSQHSQRYSPSL